METQFDIVLSLKTCKGFIDYGTYALGNDRDIAYALFAQMKGSETLLDYAALHIDLVETEHQVPCKVKTVCCTLEELCANVKLITREIFRLKNLEEIP